MVTRSDKSQSVCGSARYSLIMNFLFSFVNLFTLNLSHIHWQLYCMTVFLPAPMLSIMLLRICVNAITAVYVSLISVQRFVSFDSLKCRIRLGLQNGAFPTVLIFGIVLGRIKETSRNTISVSLISLWRLSSFKSLTCRLKFGVQDGIFFINVWHRVGAHIRQLYYHFLCKPRLIFWRLVFFGYFRKCTEI